MGGAFVQKGDLICRRGFEAVESYGYRVPIGIRPGLF